jgi:hypothetical protein
VLLNVLNVEKLQVETRRFVLNVGNHLTSYARHVAKSGAICLSINFVRFVAVTWNMSMQRNSYLKSKVHRCMIFNVKNSREAAPTRSDVTKKREASGWAVLI